MNKRLLPPVLALALLLCACGGGREAAFSTGQAQTLLDAGLFDGEMAPVDPSIVALLYGIDQEDIVGCVSYQAVNTAVSADELTILELSGEKAAQTAQAACQDRVDSQISVCRDYCSAAVPRLEGAVVRRAGSTVLLAVGDPDALPGAADALLR